MDVLPTSEELARFHRYFAVECNNAAWDLAAKPGRTPRDNRAMLYRAYSAAYHWEEIGSPLNDARAEVTLAQVHALLGQGDLALEYAQSCLEYFQENPAEDWDLAFAHLVMAHAAAAASDAVLHTRHYEEARRLGEAIADEGDRTVFYEELASIPDRI